MIKAIKDLTSYVRPPGFHAISLKKPLDNFEFATMALSLLRYRRCAGKMNLFLDKASLRMPGMNKLAAVYDSVRLIEPPDGVDTDTFWAWPKLEAMALSKAPCAAVDIDMVLGSRWRLQSGITVLHPEPPEWEVYQDSPMRRKINSVCGLERDAGCNPCNTAVLRIMSDKFRAEYAGVARALMKHGSGLFATPYGQEILVDDRPVRNMVLVEQYLISALATARGVNVTGLGGLAYGSRGTDHFITRGGVVSKTFHLWNSKAFYRKHDRAREVFIGHCMSAIYHEVDLIKDEKVRDFTGEAIFAGLVEAGCPRLLVTDTNGGGQRWSYPGEWYGPGEIVTDMIERKAWRA